MDYSFSGCDGLKNVVFDPLSDFRGIYGYTFENCTSLQSIVLPASITYLYENIFDGCTALKKIELKGDNFTSFNGSAFAGLEDGGTLILPCINDNDFFINGLGITDIEDATE